ncbi:serine hydrolase [Phytohabitans aurantiacus]|uniref:Serine hydrolase n=2 Tax=Phytohabitans aurantiacus TaxID=3016789 RepID=A0ABQ5R6C4_9ACTN|nr:serine hydrolase [Phytohabitans aurantiacus]
MTITLAKHAGVLHRDMESLLSRRSALGVLGVAPVVASGVFAGATPVRAEGTAAGSDRVPRDLRPGGAFDRRLSQLAAEGRLSGTVLLAHKGKTVLERAYGMANARTSVRNGPDTAFALASVAKLFTAIAVSQLAERGQVDFGQTIGAYLDGFPASVAGSVTVHHLLTHTSGMGNFQDSEEFRANVASWTSGAAMLDGIMGVVRETELRFAPGTRHDYSNSGFVTLGAIVQAVSGQPFYDYIREHVFAAAGMTRTDYYTLPQRLTDDRIARPYALLSTGERVDTLERPDLFWAGFIGEPAGDAFASARDMARFARALTGNRLLGPAYTTLAVTGKHPLPRNPGTPPGAIPPHQAYGPIASITRGQRIIGHGGGSPGAATSIDMYLDTGWVVVILSNHGDITVNPPVSQVLMQEARRLIIG